MRGLLAGEKFRRAGLFLLVMLEVFAIAVALVFLVAAGLMTKTFLIIRQVDPGFDAGNLLTAQITLPAAKYATGDQQAHFFSEVLKRVESLPGVQSAGLAAILPFSGRDAAAAVEVEGYPTRHSEEHPISAVDGVSPNYFQAMRIPLLRGRPFTEQDGATEPGVVVISEQMARRLWFAQDPIGRRMRLRGWQLSWRTIVGVVGDVKYGKLSEVTEARTYLPYLQVPSNGMSLAVRCEQDPARLAEALRKAVWSVDRDQPVADITTMEQRLWASLKGPREIMRLSLVYAALALIVAMAAAFGVVVCWPVRRAEERGTPMSFGSRQGKILRLVVVHGLPMLLLGVGIGLRLAFLSARLMTSSLYGVTPTDPGILGLSVLVVCAGVLLACYAGAWRTSRGMHDN
jgi:putative ABC transport system permease protein